ncbi:MAG TPA: sulfotransferase [Rhodothermales bacterium]|nr:sulfotransferase [Rhodothermales bacterium]
MKSSEGKVFGIGLSKTGTTSMYAALDELGYRAGTFGHLKELGLDDWLRGDFSTDYLKNLDAVTDLPIGIFYPELDKRYPGSKFILTTREYDAWAASCKSQFTRNADPKGFNRDVRVATYGISGYSEQIFRHVFETHRRNVEWYFRDRPEDLLILDVCAGDGWEKLCHFLEKQVPQVPFPSVKPGFRAERIVPEIVTSTGLGEIDPDRSFTFVIPVRNPLDSKVDDYRTIDTLLEMTVRSLFMQTYPNVSVVVCCHGAPDWAEKYPDRLRFLDVSNHDAFRPDQNHVVIDKGLKYVIGALYATTAFDPDLIMLIDADDYVNVELAERLLRVQAGQGLVDGYVINRGLHVRVDVDPGSAIRYEFALMVRDFDQTCGSCRIFDAKRLAARIREIDADIVRRFTVWPSPDARHAVPVPESPVQWLWDVTTGRRERPDNLVNLLGRHTKQHGYFEFRPVDFVGAAKGCGHGNHDGPRGGTVHWQREIGRIPIDEFLSTFGLPYQEGSFTDEEIRLAKAADKASGRIWDDP